MAKKTQEEIDKLIKESAKRMMALTEYSFIVNEDDEDVDVDAPEGGEDLGAEVDNIEADLGIDDEPAPEGGDDFGGDDFGGDDFGGDFGGDEGGGFGDEPMPEEPAEDEVELDVTDLVNSTEEAKLTADETNANVANLINQFNTLQGQLAKMDSLSQNIEALGGKVTDLEHDIQRRNPTPEEQIEMRSLDSYPYNLKLSDYWLDNEDKLAKPDEYINGQKKEYVLKKSDVDNFSPNEIKNSFTSEYEEEDID
tara:strand:+ start:9950 stop:10705 length:756 start_codon:yes stop_codon:yes gene_type:complete